MLFHSNSRFLGFALGLTLLSFGVTPSAKAQAIPASLLSQNPSISTQAQSQAGQIAIETSTQGYNANVAITNDLNFLAYMAGLQQMVAQSVIGIFRG